MAIEKTREQMREEIRLKSRWVRPVTKALFPVGVPVVVEAIVDTRSGWEFDAPMHIMRPFHRYCEVGSITSQALEDRIKDILLDLDLGDEIKPDDHAWPYTGEYLKRVFRQVQKGQRLDRFWHLRSTVVVNSWANDDSGCVDYDVTTKER